MHASPSCFYTKVNDAFGARRADTGYTSEANIHHIILDGLLSSLRTHTIPRPELPSSETFLCRNSCTSGSAPATYFKAVPRPPSLLLPPSSPNNFCIWKIVKQSQPTILVLRPQVNTNHRHHPITNDHDLQHEARLHCHTVPSTPSRPSPCNSPLCLVQGSGRGKLR